MVERVDRKNEASPSWQKFVAGIDLGLELDDSGEDLAVKIFEINGHNSGYVDTWGNDRQRDNFFGTKAYAELYQRTYEKIADLVSKNFEDFNLINEFFIIAKDVEFRGYEAWKKKYEKSLSIEVIEKLDKEIYGLIGLPLYKENAANPIGFELWTRSKRLQYDLDLIPEKYRIRRWKPGDSCRSKYGFWVLRLDDMQQSKGMRIISDRKLAFLQSYSPEIFSKYVVTEFVKTAIKTSRVDQPPSFIRSIAHFKVKKVGGKLLVDISKLENVRVMKKNTNRLIYPFTPSWVGKVLFQKINFGEDPFRSTVRFNYLIEEAVNDLVVNLVSKYYHVDPGDVELISGR